MAYKRACQLEQRIASAPIRMPERSLCLSGQRRIQVKQPRVTPEHKRHLGISFRRLYFPLSIFPPLAIVQFWLGGIEIWLGAICRKKPIHFIVRTPADSSCKSSSPIMNYNGTTHCKSSKPYVGRSRGRIGKEMVFTKMFYPKLRFVVFIIVHEHGQGRQQFAHTA